MNILVIGTSHAGAIKIGLDKLVSEQFCPNEIQVDYACASIKNFQRFSFASGLLSHPRLDKVQKTGVQFPLELEMHDKIIYIAGANPLKLKHYFPRANNSGHSSPLSRSNIESIVFSVAGALPFNKNFDLLQNLKEKHLEKLFIVPHPLISEESKSGVIDRPIPPDLIDIIRDTSNRSLKKVDVPSIILPPDTLLSSCQQYTKKIYNQGGANVKGKEIRKDFMHMNGAYGEIYAKKILAILRVS